MDTKLILIEGLPSSGKTTIAKITKQILDEMKIDNKLYLEGNLDHPTDYDRVAYFNKGEYNNLLENNKEYVESIKNITDKKENGYFISYYKKLKGKENYFPEELFKEIKKNDIYELSLELNKKLILDKWKKFVQKAKTKNKVYIFECVFIQNPITVSIIRDNALKETAFCYVKEILKIIKELNPILIYLKQDDIEGSFKKVIEERPDW